MRVPNWSSRLAEVIEQWRAVPLVYGKSDCLQFCADVTHAITGRDYLSKFPTYESEMAAAKILFAAGGMRPLISSVLGNEKHPAFAFRGDVVVAISADGKEAAGICLGVVWAGPGDAGLAFHPMTAAVAAWTV